MMYQLEKNGKNKYIIARAAGTLNFVCIFRSFLCLIVWAFSPRWCYLAGQSHPATELVVSNKES